MENLSQKYSYNVCCICFFCPMLFLNDFFELFLVPFIHIFVLFIPERNTNVWAMLTWLYVNSNDKNIIASLGTASKWRNIYLASAYKFRFAAFPSTDGSWLNLHLSPFLHRPCLKKAQNTDLGSTPEIGKVKYKTFKRKNIILILGIYVNMDT